MRSLAYVQIPDDEAKLSDIQSALETGEALFKQGADVEGARYTAHGQFCLGVLALTREEWGHAARALELALSVFESERARYQRGDLVERCRLYLGIALALALEVTRD